MAAKTKLDIRSILLKGNYISLEEAENAESASKKKKIPLLDYLFSEGLINKDILGQAIAEHYGVPYADLNTQVPSKEQVLMLPEVLAKKYNLILFRVEKNKIIVATDNPDNKAAVVELQALFKDKKVNLAYSLTDDIRQIFNFYHKTLDTRFGKIIKEENKVAPEIIEEILADAISYNCSDVHFEPQENGVVIRFRIDGILQEAGSVDYKYYENIINRFKVLSLLRIDEHHTTQDGAFRINSEWGMVDVRLSIAPTFYGEKVVLRLLAKHVDILNLDNLGLSEKTQKIISDVLKKPFGMVLSAGPTGSGKSTTLYALLKRLSSAEKNITTIEDPIEYILNGANQIQVSQEKNITFAKGLRSIVRQDPDIILVGEIRDKETAEISVNAALTGHLLFSTFHANNAAAVIPRLIDMGVEPFLLASTLELVIAQRLVRKICDNCRFSYSLDHKELSALSPAIATNLKKTKILYKGKGCSVCNNTGYKGRTAIFELLKTSPEIQDLINNKAQAKDLWLLAKRQGSQSLFEDGLEKVKLGITTLEELFRVAPIDL
ncbi:type II/IV secretion system protein [Candidatus Kuenenbacteria bacterium]|nr:type II/IV secretion system protein [Candidatus Kuenenbacteria bacterium]